MHTHIRDAIAFFTGGRWRPSSLPGWDVLNLDLEKDGICPYEYCYYIVHVYPRTTGLPSLQFLNTLRLPETIRLFKEWKKEQRTEVTANLESQKVRLDGFREAGIPVRGLLFNDLEMICAPLRIDYAIRHMKDPSEIINTYRDEAIYMMTGCSEYALQCPLAAEALHLSKKGDA